jgi:hypothetical protein
MKEQLYLGSKRAFMQTLGLEIKRQIVRSVTGLREVNDWSAPSETEEETKKQRCRSTGHCWKRRPLQIRKTETVVLLD